MSETSANRQVQQNFAANPPMYSPAPNQQQKVPVQVMAGPANFGPEPARTTCPHCQRQIITRINYEASGKTHLLALLLFPFCCIPYSCDSCQNANHYCSSCNAFLGTYK